MYKNILNFLALNLKQIIGFLLFFVFFVFIIIPLMRTVEFSTLMGFPKPANDTMFSIIALLSEMTILLTFILFAILIALAYIVDIYNAENNPFPRHFEKTVESTLDVLFVVFPTIIIIYLLIPSLGFIFNNETAVETVFDLDIIGHQWYWSYEYSLSIGIALYDIFANENTLFNKIEFDSLMDQEATYNRLLQVDKRVIIPVHTFIKATVTSQDVIHSWAIPQLGIKYDAIPGRLVSFILHSNMLGVFYGQCSELCGVNHAFMPICVQCVENDIFLDWVLLSLHINPSKIILDSVGVSLFSNFLPVENK
jgi:heme/copper-type cytochrome/quinol oxidase subunit 2